jgi:peptidylprolyl isomerase
VGEAKNGDTITVHYTGKLSSGAVFDTSIDGDPLQFTIGAAQVAQALEKAAVGMSPGESRTVRIPAAEAYGPYCNELVLVLARDQFPAWLKPEIGQLLEVHVEDGESMPVVVASVSDSSVTLDANHPLAGEDLSFDMQLVEII